MVLVFGWGKKKEQKRVETIPQEKEIRMEDIPKIISDDNNLRQNSLISEFDLFRKKIIPKTSELLKIIKQLEKDDLKVDDIDKNLRILVVRGKKQVISTIKKEAKSDFPEISSLEQAEKLHNEINLMLKKMGDVLGRQSRVIHIFAKKYADRLKIILENLNSDRTEIQVIFDNYKKKAEDSQIILETLEKIKQTKSQITQKNNRVKEIQELLKKDSQEIETLTDKIYSLKESKDYKKYLELQGKINSLNSEKSSIKKEIEEQFTKISRPLSKYVYVSSLDKQQKHILEQLVENPGETIPNHAKDDVVVILQAVRKGVQGGSISVKDTEKSISYIDETTEQIGGYYKKFTEFAKKKKELENKLIVFDIAELDRTNLELDRAKNDLETHKMKLEDLQLEIKEFESLLQQLISQVEAKLKNLTATQYKIIKS